MSLRKTLSTALLALAAVSASAQTPEPLDATTAGYTRAIENSVHILDYVSSVMPTLVPYAIERIGNGEFQRRAPNYPVWILDATEGTILYYEGQDGFKYQDATKLIDENGKNFGLAVLRKAQSSRSGWHRITLGAEPYSMYCAQRPPFAVCSVIPLPKK